VACAFAADELGGDADAPLVVPAGLPSKIIFRRRDSFSSRIAPSQRS
jgi:hypothetical protein